MRHPVLLVCAAGLFPLVVAANPEYARENKVPGLWTYDAVSQLPSGCVFIASKRYLPDKNLGPSERLQEVYGHHAYYGLSIAATHSILPPPHERADYYQCPGSDDG